MTAQPQVVPPPTTAPVLPPPPRSRRARREERRRLRRQDRLAARLAELSRLDLLLADAGSLIGQGWVQHAWFRYRDDAGEPRVATVFDLGRMSGRPVIGACLVGGLVQAGGGPAAARSQLVTHAVELTWHTLHEPASRAVRWTPSPLLHAAHVRDLTRWNDSFGRTSYDVTGLLEAATTTVRAEVARAREEQAAL